jgi:hypothetical protein
MLRIAERLNNITQLRDAFRGRRRFTLSGKASSERTH